jgi:hypothetical protein
MMSAPPSSSFLHGALGDGDVLRGLADLLDLVLDRLAADARLRR